MKNQVRMYTTKTCGDCRRAKWFLQDRKIEFEEIYLEDAPEAVEFVMKANNGRRCVPTFEVNGRTFRCSPFDPRILIRELGL